MKRAHSLVVGIALVACVAIGLAPGAGATVLTLDFDDAEKIDFQTQSYVEGGASATVDAGHYEVVADSGGADGDQAFQMDEESFGLSQVTFSLPSGEAFHVLSVEVVNPAEAPGEYTISALNGLGGVLASIPAPTVAGPFFFGPEFENASALVIAQSASGAFAIDDLTINALPEPAAALSLLASLGALGALHRRRRA